ncbi:hypothetical protein PLICRDRAFT_83421, partial [Plicaturopsis crispa FD-325 SS-3]
LADALGMHRNTLRHHLQMHGVHQRFSDIPDHEIDILVRHFKQEKPTSGLRYLIGFFKRHKIRVQKR